MNKLNEKCKLTYEHINIIISLKDKKIKELSKKYEGYTIQFRHKKDPQKFLIIHPSSKKPGYIQATYFDSFGAINDFMRKNYLEIFDSLFYEYPFSCYEIEQIL